MGFRQQLDACKQKQLWEAGLLFWDEDIVFLGHTNWSTKHGGSNQSRTADIPSKVLAAVNHSGSYLSLHERTDTQTVLAKFHQQGVVNRFKFDLSRYSSISTHPGENNSKRTAVVLIPNTLRWNAPMFYHFWCWTNATLMRTSTNNSLFSSNCTTWLIDGHPNWLEENIFKVLHIVPLDLQFCHMQRHVRWHVNIFHSHIHQRPLRTMDACTTQDGCDGRDQTKMR